MKKEKKEKLSEEALSKEWLKRQNEEFSRRCKLDEIRKREMRITLFLR